MSKRKRSNQPGGPGLPRVVGLELIEPRMDAPDVVGEGRVDCPCGLFWFGPFKFTPPAFCGARAQCPNCGRWLESLPVTEGGDG